MSQTSQSQSSPFRKIATVSAVIGGGAIGADYATWLDIPPVVGVAGGALLGYVLEKALEGIRDDERGEIQNTCVQIGFWLGGLFGLLAGVGTGEGFGAVVAGSVVGAIGGAIAGKIVFGLLGFAAAVLLLISRGPLGSVFRATLLQLDQGETPQGVSQCLPGAETLADVILWV